MINFFFLKKKDINVCNYSIKKVYVSSFGERWSFFFFFLEEKMEIYILRIRWRYTCVSNSEIQFMGWKRNRWLVFCF